MGLFEYIAEKTQHFHFKQISKQECIPVGCVAPALYRTGGGGLPDRNPPGRRPQHTEPPPQVNRMTDRYKNITLPQTSFADSN